MKITKNLITKWHCGKLTNDIPCRCPMQFKSDCTFTLPFGTKLKLGKNGRALRTSECKKRKFKIYAEYEK